MSTLEKNTRDFLSNPINSYCRLAEYLNNAFPRTDGVRWTKDSAYHYCRKNGIASRRRCRSQPAASITQRSRSRDNILRSLTSALRVSGTPLASIAPFKISDISRLSGIPFATVASNWHQLERELLSAAKLPPKPVVLHIVEDEV